MAKTATKVSAKKSPAKKSPAKKAAAPKTATKATAKATKAPVKSASKPAAAKKTTAATKTSSGILTLRHIAETLSTTHELPKRQANEFMTQVVEMITKSLKKGDKIRLSGLGILQVRKRAARTGRNPQTGEAIKIKASKKIAFRAAKELKQAI